MQLFTNQEVLDVNQKAKQPKEAYRKNGTLVWMSKVPGSKDVNVAVFNTSDSARNVIVEMKLLGVTGKTKVRDLWKNKNEGIFENEYRQILNAHGAALYRMSPL